MTAKNGWKHCYAAARQAARHYQTGLYYADIAHIETTAYYFMLASDDVRNANTGYQPTGSVYTAFKTSGFVFNVYTHDDTGVGKCHTFEFKFGESTPESKHATDNRNEWQLQAQAVERIAELRSAKRDIARLLNGMADDDFFQAYAVIKTIAKSAR